MVEMTIYRIINTDNPVRPATGLADFRWKKHENLCTPFHTPQPKAGSSVRAGISKGKSLDTAAIKIFVAFYKERCKP
jgi:hypothetical protein